MKGKLDGSYIVRLKSSRTYKTVFWSAVGLLLVIASLSIFLKSVVSPYRGKVNNKKALPVATMGYLNPTEEYPNGSLIKYTYAHGSITINKGFVGARNLTPNHLYAEIKTNWPEFGLHEKYKNSKPKNRIRIIFAIGQTAPFLDVYNSSLSSIEKNNAVDTRFSGFIGYRSGLSWLFFSQDDALRTPQGTPVVISCTDDDAYGLGPDLKQGQCRYNLIFDESLRAQLRFNKPLMKNFEKVHVDLMEFIDTIREIK